MCARSMSRDGSVPLPVFASSARPVAVLAVPACSRGRQCAWPRSRRWLEHLQPFRMVSHGRRCTCSRRRHGFQRHARCRLHPRRHGWPGIFSSPGPATCANHAGSWGTWSMGAQTCAAWGIDRLKYDLRGRMSERHRRASASFRSTWDARAPPRRIQRGARSGVPVQPARWRLRRVPSQAVAAGALGGVERLIGLVQQG